MRATLRHLEAGTWDTPQKMTFLLKFYVIFVPERHFCGVSLALAKDLVRFHHKMSIG
jgi:hypothetical protein